MRVGIYGFLPPPETGQAVTTRRLISCLQTEHDVLVVRTPRVGEGVFVIARLLSWLRALWSLRSCDRIIWSSMSVAGLGHLRDLLTLPLLGSSRTVAWLHWGELGNLVMRPWRGRSLRWILNRLCATVLLYESMAGEAQAAIGNVRVIPNLVGSDLSEADVRSLIVARRERLNEPNYTARVLFLSTLFESKGVLLAAEAVQLCRTVGGNVLLDVIGPWPSEVEKRRVEPVLTGYSGVTVCPPVDSSRVLELMDEYDLLILPTFYPTEAQPLVILEAMSRGLPVVATPWRGIPDQLGPEYVGLCSRNAPSVASGIMNLVRPQANEVAGRELHGRFLSRFSEGAVREQWLSLLADIGNPSNLRGG